MSDTTTRHTPRSDPFGFDPGHIVDMRVEMAGESDELPAEWPCEIVRRAAKLMKERAENATMSASGRWIIRASETGYPQQIADNASAILIADCFEAPGVDRTSTHIMMLDPVPVALIADAWGHQADDMCDCLAHFHAFGPPGSWVIDDEQESVHWDWTATVRAALAYLREDAPAVTR